MLSAAILSWKLEFAFEILTFAIAINQLLDSLRRFQHRRAQSQPAQSQKSLPKEQQEPTASCLPSIARPTTRLTLPWEKSSSVDNCDCSVYN
jgi:DNA-directed RNA polymerase specialized sigma24 family protein